jgi:fibronectin-binding autotransporter adhesin
VILETLDDTADLTLTTLTATDIETVNLITTGESAVTVGTVTTGAVTTLNIAAETDTTVGTTTGLTITTVDASESIANVALTFGAAATTVTGGLGNDTFNFGTNLTTTDEIDGGLGDNTVTATLAAGTVAPTMTNVQTLAVTGTGGSLNAANISGLTLLQSTNNAAMTIQNLAGTVATIEQTGGTSGVQYLYAAGADATVTLQNSAAVTNTSTRVSNVQNLTVTAAESTADAYVLGGLTADANLENLTLVSGAVGETLAAGAIAATGVQTLTLEAGAAALSMTTLANAGSLQTIDITSTGGPTSTGAIGGGTAAAALTSIDVNALGGDIDLGNITATGATIDNYTVNASGTYGTSSTGTLAANNVSSFAVTATGTTGTSVTTGAQTLAGSMGSIDVNSGLNVVIGGVSTGNGGLVGGISDVNVTLTGAFGASTVGALAAAVGNIGNVTLTTTGGAGTSLALNNGGAALATTAGDIGDITISSADRVLVGTVIAGTAGNIGDISVTLTGDTHAGASSTGVIEAAGDDVGNVTINNSGNLGFTLGAVTALTVGDVAITTDTTNGTATVALNLSAVAGADSAIGNITVTAEDNVTFTGGLGNVDSLGNITIDAAAGATVAMNTIGGALTEVGNLTLSGAGTISMATGAVASLGTLDATGVSGSVTLTLNNSTVSAVTYDGGTGTDIFAGTGGADVINAGTGTDSITGNDGADSIDLGADTAIDHVVFTTKATVDSVSNFIAANDISDYYVSAFDAGGAAILVEVGAGGAAAAVVAADAIVLQDIAAADALDNGSNVIMVSAQTFANAAAAEIWIEANVTSGAGNTFAAGNQLVFVYELTAGGVNQAIYTTGNIAADGALTGDLANVATLVGVDLADIAGGNFSFV